MEMLTQETPIQLCVTHSPPVTRVFLAAMHPRHVWGSTIGSITKRGVPFSGDGLSTRALFPNGALQEVYLQFFELPANRPLSRS